MRHHDYRLDDEQIALQESFRDYFTNKVSSARVREAQPMGFDPVLWQELQERAIVSMGLPETEGGDGAGLLELALVCEEAGRRAVPAPLPEVLAAVRGLVRLNAPADVVAQIRDGAAIATVAPGDGDRRLVPAGAIAATIVAPRGQDLLLLRGDPAPLQPNLADAPLGWRRVGPDGGSVVGSADDWVAIERDWHLLTAATLIGLGQAALDRGVQYAKDRLAFGVPIGTFQAVAHPLVNAANAIDASRRLLWRAAWFCDHEPDHVGAQVLSALVAAGGAAERAGAAAIHTQGGFGVTLESDVQIYYRRAKGLAVMAGDRRTLLRRIARHAIESADEKEPAW